MDDVVVTALEEPTETPRPAQIESVAHAEIGDRHPAVAQERHQRRLVGQHVGGLAGHPGRVDPFSQGNEQELSTAVPEPLDEP